MPEREESALRLEALCPWWQRPRFWLGMWWLWFGVLFVFSSIPGHEMARQPFQFNDKAQHTLYFMGGAMALGALEVARGRWPQRWWLLPLMTALVGAFDETHQWFTPSRTVELADWIADLLGGFLAIPGVFVWQAMVRRWQAARSVVPVTEPPPGL